MKRGCACLGALLFALLLLLVPGFVAAAIPAPPAKDIYLTDNAQMVQAEDRQNILAIGEDLNQRFGAQLVVVTVDSLAGEDIESYANRLFRAWGIGDAQKNNGVLLLVAKEDRKFRIEVGYGLEGAITDGFAGEVLDGMTPKFKDGEYSAGISQAYQRLARKIYNEYDAVPPENVQVTDIDEEWDLIDYILVFVLVLVLIVAGYFIGPVTSFLASLIVMVLFFLGNALLYIVTLGHWGSLSFRGGSSSGSSGSSSGYDSSSSSDSDDSGGFGGGSSGGGGASGGW